jgi:hypothetical protein
MNVGQSGVSGVGRVDLSAWTTWYGHLLWVLGVGVLSMAVTATFAGILELPRPIYLVFYFAVIGSLLYGYVRWSGVDVWKGFREHWIRGLILGSFFGFLAVQTVLIQSPSPTSQGAGLAFDLVWFGLIYGAVDGLLLSVFPVYSTWRALSMLGWTERWYGKIVGGVLALVASMFMIALYHLGYPEFRGPQVLVVIVGVGAQSLGYLLSRSPLAPVISHIAMHVAAVLYGIASVSQLPPHY